jgi:serine/threonine-protein kinase
VKTCPQCGKEYDEQTKFCPTDGSTLRSVAGDDIIGSVIADRYHVLRKLGEGGMGQVYLAEHVKMGRMSAIKVMSAALIHDADAVGRFNREAANASKISHPNIAAIYDFGETSDGLIYLAMEFVEGESLTKLCEALGALPAPRAAEIARQVASALEAAHERGIVHRDLKPDNIMISRGRDGTDVVKVVDFGIAKAAEGAGQKVTRTGLVVGTPEYMSPEQLTGDPLDGRSDLYALGLVTFNMLTGSLPFTGQTTHEALLKRLTERPLSLAEARPDLVWPAPLQQVLDKALSRLAADRYQHASEFGAAIAAAVAGMPVDAPQSAPTRQVAATPTPAASVAATVPSPAAAAPPATANPASARERFLVPAILAIAVLALVGGALYARARRAHASVQVATVAPTSAPIATTAAPADTMRQVDTTSHSAPDSARASTALAAVDSALASAPPAPVVAPPPASHASPSKSQTKRALPSMPKHADVAATQTAPAAIPPAVDNAPAPAPPPPPAPAEPSTPEQGRALVDAAGQMVSDGKAAEAIATARRAMPLLTTRDDSVTALFYLAQGMVQRSARTGEQESRKRACSILALIGKATSHPKAGEIRSFSSRECK